MTGDAAPPTKVSGGFPAGLGHAARRVLTIVLLVAALTLVGTGLWRVSGKIADEFHFAIPGRLPTFIGYSGRDYEDSLAYETGRVTCYRLRPADLPLRRVGTLFGFLTASRPKLVTGAESRGLPTVIYVPDHGDCYRVYELLGGP